MSDLRELDFHAAQVLGWRRLVSDMELVDRPWFCRQDGLEVWPNELPHFSTNIADAWKLVEALSPTGEIGKEPHGWKQFRLTSLYDGYHASFFTVSGKDIYDSIALAPAKAITLAALKAKGIDVSKWEG